MITRRTALKLLAMAWPALKGTKTFPAAQGEEVIQPGPFQGTRESLEKYEVPQWFRDAKFGIWAHWGPQSAAETGDWYARNMYIHSDRQTNRHPQDSQHPSKTPSQ